MYIIRNGNTIMLSDNELERAYREREKQYLLQDAELKLYEYYDIDYEGSKPCAGERQLFKDVNGFSIEDACNPASESYLLGYMYERFVDCRDCNVPENDTWEHVVQSTVKKHKAKA